MRWFRRGRPGTVVLVGFALALGLLLVQPAPAAHALTFTVTTTTDAPDALPGDGVCATATLPSEGVRCTLRAAVMEANFLGGSHSITLPSGNYVLTIAPANPNDDATGDLNVQASLTITGAGAASTIIDGNATDRVFTVESPVSMNLSGVTLRNGRSPSGPRGCLACLPPALPGAEIFAAVEPVSVTLASAAVLDSSSFASQAPSAIFATTVTVTDSVFGPKGAIDATGSMTVSGSSLTGSSSIFATSAALTISDSTFQDSSIFGQASQNTNLTISNVTFHNGTVSGGNVSLSNSTFTGTLNIVGTTITPSNTTFSGQGALNAGNLTMSGGTLDGISIGNGTIDLTNMTIRNSSNVGVSGTQLKIKNSTITGNAGGVAATQSLELTDSTVSSNTTTGNGGGVSVGGTGTITRSTITDNKAGRGGGVNSTGPLTVTGSTIGANTATANEGGGVYSTGPLTVTNSTIKNNTASQTDGGGVAIAGGTVNVVNVTISGNSAPHSAANGGGIWMSEGALTLINVTLSQNSAAGLGGGILLRDGSAAGSPTIDATNLTIARNSAPVGSGIDFVSGTLRLKNTIVANNTGSPDCAHPTAAITSLGHNFDSGTSCGFSDPTDKNNADPKLGPLSSNGAIETYPLLPGSPAIDAGDNNGCPATDARGITRPLDGNGDGTPVCDIGAYEAAPNTTPPASTCSPRPPIQVTTVPESPGRLRVTVTATGPGSPLSALHFGAASNAQIDAPGAAPGATGPFDVATPAGASSYTFVVRRTTAGQGVNVPFTVTDACGNWPTFVGGGPSAF